MADTILPPPKRRRAPGSRHGGTARRLSYEPLERRTLLAGDLAGLSVFDVNDDVPIVGDDTASIGAWIFSAAGKVIFPGVTSEGGAEIQIVDVETLDTSTLEVNPGLADSNPQHVTTVGNIVYFSAYDSRVGNELRWFDASQSVPVLQTVDVRPGPESSNAGQWGGFYQIGDQLFFTATDATYGTELRWIDLTEPTQPVNTLDIWAGPGDSNAGEYGGFLSVGDRLFFTARDAEHGDELRWIDTRQSAFEVKTLDANPGRGSSFAGRKGGFAAAQDRLFFSAADDLGYQPRWIDATIPLPNLHTISINRTGGSDPDRFTAVGGKVFFTADDDGPFGNELHWVDASATAPTLNSLDILAGPRDSDVGRAGGFAAVGQRLYFSANDGTHGVELGWIDASQTTLTYNSIDIAAGSVGSRAGALGGFSVDGERLFFNAYDRESGSELRWITSSGEPPIVNTVDILDGPGDSDAGQFGGFHAVDGRLFFTSKDEGSGFQLRWLDMSALATVATPPVEEDGDAKVPVLAIEGYGGSESSSAHELTVVGSRLYFVAQDSRFGQELRWTDDNGASTETLDIDGGTRGSRARDLTVVDEKLFFVATDSDFGEELRWIDTTLDPPVLNTVDVWSGGGGSNAAAQGGLARVGDKLYFRASDRTHGNELRWIDLSLESPSVNTLDLNPGSGGSQAHEMGGFASIDDKLYFDAVDDPFGHELRWINTTEASPVVNTIDVASGSLGSDSGVHGGFVITNDRLFFNAFDVTFGSELRWIDTGLESPIVHTIDIEPNEGNSRAGRFGGFAFVDDRLFFTANDSTYGIELRWLDTTVAEPTFHTIDVNPNGGSTAGELGGFQVVGQRLYFSANDNDVGTELRWLDTEALDTMETDPIVHTLDLKPGATSSWAGEFRGFTPIGNLLFFDGDDGVSGRELNWIDTTDLLPTAATLDIWSGVDGSQLRLDGGAGITVLNETLYVVADTFGFGVEVFALDLNNITTPLPADLNRDGVVDGDDVEVVCEAIGGPFDEQLDFDGNAVHDYADVVAFVQTVIGSQVGDANLDGMVDAGDLNQVGLHWQQSTDATQRLRWSEGDFNCDDRVNAADLNAVGLNWLFPHLGESPLAQLATVSEDGMSKRSRPLSDEGVETETTRETEPSNDDRDSLPPKSLTDLGGGGTNHRFNEFAASSSSHRRSRVDVAHRSRRSRIGWRSGLAHFEGDNGDAVRAVDEVMKQLWRDRL